MGRRGRDAGCSGLEAGRRRDDAALLCRCSAAEFVEAARIFGDFFYGVAQLGWNESSAGGQWVRGWI